MREKIVTALWARWPLLALTAVAMMALEVGGVAYRWQLAVAVLLGVVWPHYPPTTH